LPHFLSKPEVLQKQTYATFILSVLQDDAWLMAFKTIQIREMEPKSIAFASYATGIQNLVGLEPTHP